MPTIMQSVPLLNSLHMWNKDFFFSLLLCPILSLLSVCHICGLCGDVSLLRMDSPAQKRPYYIYILLHHSETMPAGLQNFGQKEGEKAKGEEGK